MPTTPLHGWETPEGSAQPQVHIDLQSLADAIDADTPVAASTAPAHRAGRIWYNITAGLVFISNGSNWQLLGRQELVRTADMPTQSPILLGTSYGNLHTPISVQTFDAGPVTIEFTGYIYNAISGAPRFGRLKGLWDGALLGTREMLYLDLLNTAGDTPGYSFVHRTTLTSVTPGNHTFVVQGSASNASSVQVDNLHVSITQGLTRA